MTTMSPRVCTNFVLTVLLGIPQIKYIMDMKSLYYEYEEEHGFE